MNDSSEQQAREYVGTIRDMIRHEDMLLNQRLTWMWTLQGLLVGGASVFWSKNAYGVLIIVAVGLLSSVSIWYSLNRGLRAIRGLLAAASERKRELSIACAMAPTMGARQKAIEWLLPAHVIPWTFIGAWLLLAVVRLLGVD